MSGCALSYPVERVRKNWTKPRTSLATVYQSDESQRVKLMHQSRSRRDQNKSAIALTVKLFESLTPGDIWFVT